MNNAFMEASVATAIPGDDVEASLDPVADQLKEAATHEERAMILAPCIAEVIKRQGHAINILDPDNAVHACVRGILKKTGVIES